MDDTVIERCLYVCMDDTVIESLRCLTVDQLCVQLERAQRREWRPPRPGSVRGIVSLSGEANPKTGVTFITVGNKGKTRKESLVTLPWPDDGQAYGSYHPANLD